MHGRGACMTGKYAWQGACMAEGACMVGGMHSRGCVWQGVCVAEKNGNCSGWYASYWNAFLFGQFFC